MMSFLLKEEAPCGIISDKHVNKQNVLKMNVFLVDRLGQALIF